MAPKRTFNMVPIKTLFGILGEGFGKGEMLVLVTEALSLITLHSGYSEPSFQLGFDLGLPVCPVLAACAVPSQQRILLVGLARILAVWPPCISNQAPQPQPLMCKLLTCFQQESCLASLVRIPLPWCFLSNFPSTDSLPVLLGCKIPRCLRCIQGWSLSRIVISLRKNLE